MDNGINEDVQLSQSETSMDTTDNGVRNRFETDIINNHLNEQITNTVSFIPNPRTSEIICNLQKNL